MSEMRRAGNALTEQDKTDIRRDIGLGTAATADIPSSGNATSSQVVRGNDTRLSDARTPTSHTHTASQVTDFSTAADARIAAASINALSDVTVTSPSTGQVLKWNGSVWVNDTDATGGGGGGGGAGTDLGYIASPTGGTVTSSTGDDASLTLSSSTNAGLQSPAQHDKLAGIQAGATANATDAQLRDRSTHTGTQSVSTITGLATVATTGAYADLSGRPALASVATSGAYLDLTGRPTLSTVASSGAYSDLTGRPTLGTAAPLDVPASGNATGLQVVKGDDTRLSDSREWTAETISQAEAEAGTATTRRAFTALRVFQAVAAWWQSISTAAGRALVTAADAAAQRSALGLGTAATTASTDYATAAQGAKADSALQPTIADAKGDLIVATGADTLVRLPVGATNGHALVVDSAETAGVKWAAVAGGGGGGGTKTLSVFTPMTSQPPATAFATLDTRNSIAVLDFDAAADESITWVGIIPEAANLASGLSVRIHWTATSATSGNCRWRVAFEDMIGSDIDADSFDTAVEATGAANGTSGIPTTTSITATTIDSLAAGDAYRLRLTRVGTDATNDTMTGDAEVIAVEVRGAA